MQKVLGIAWETDDDPFGLRGLVAREQRSGPDAFAEGFDNLRVFGEVFVQGLDGFDAPELKGVGRVREVLRHAPDVDFALVDGEHQRDAGFVGTVAPVVGIGNLQFLLSADGF